MVPDAEARQLFQERDLPKIAGAVRISGVLPPKGWSVIDLQQGERARFVDLHGQQVVDVIPLRRSAPADALNLGNSIALNGRIKFGVGDKLYSAACVALMEITGYTNEESFAYSSMCSREMNEVRYGESSGSCRENFADALAPWGYTYTSLPNAFAPFMRVELDGSNGITIVEPTSQPGDWYELGALEDVILAVSNCPQERNACNGFDPTALGYAVFTP